MKKTQYQKLFSIFRMNERFGCWGLIYTQSTCLLAQLLHNIASLAAYQSSHVIVQVFHCARILLSSYSFVLAFFCYDSVTPLQVSQLLHSTLHSRHTQVFLCNPNLLFSYHCYTADALKTQ